MKLIKSTVDRYQFSLLLSMIVIQPVMAEESNNWSAQLDEAYSLEGRSSAASCNYSNNNKYQQALESKFSTYAKDLLVQNTNLQAVIEVTGIRLDQTDEGLQVILETSRGQRLVPLILPEDNNLVIDILDATLALPTGNEFRKANPAPGITKITLTPIDESSIRLTITGETQAPTAEVVPSTQNLVLSVTTEGNIAQSQVDEEIEIIATGEAEEDNYYIPEASSATRTSAEIRDIPQSIQVIPQEVIKDQQAIRIEELVTNVSGVTFFGNQDGRSTDFAIRGFNNAPILRDGFRLYDRDFQGMPEVANLEKVEIMKLFPNPTTISRILAFLTITK